MNILLGMTGGIAAYKCAALVSALKKRGETVDVVMTDAAAQFISPLTMETLSGNAVATDTFSREKPYEVEHIALAKKADVAVLAPATANTIAKLACGIADNMLTTTFLALQCPVVIVPAMNTAMYTNMATQVNLQILRDRGMHILEPGSGQLACGDEGAGRMREPEEIIAFLSTVTGRRQDFAGRNVLITAGPTREMIDPVRYLTNRSSGRMGYAIAAAAQERGAKVTLVSGPVSISPPAGAKLVKVTSAAQMYDAVMAEKENADVIVMCAAVADYTPKTVSDVKMKKREELCIELVKTKDILAEVGRHKKAFLVGFAAETHGLEEYAKGKLEKKNLDMIVANDVSNKEIGFDSEHNAVSIYKKNGQARHLKKDTKRGIADAVLDEVAEGLEQ